MFQLHLRVRPQNGVPEDFDEREEFHSVRLQ